MNIWYYLIELSIISMKNQATIDVDSGSIETNTFQHEIE